MKKIKSFFDDRTKKMLPRILTQICRDPSSSYYGCCDRNWWHYKIRDFPSIILQQAILVISTSSENKEIEYKNYLEDIVQAGCLFWQQRALRYRSFEEYYPYEDGYPPLAFSTLAISKLCYQGKIEYNNISDGLNKASHKLQQKFEKDAFNQQIVGTTALAFINKITSKDTDILARLISKTLNMQTENGWFIEYGGPDIGYLSVALDSLWDLYDITNNPQCYDAIIKSTNFITKKINQLNNNLMIFNSRNTNYVLPYGILRSFYDSQIYSVELEEAISSIFDIDVSSTHYIDSIDDRYLCHYIGTSFFRASDLINKKILNQ
jgi:hypothetical protein